MAYAAYKDYKDLYGENRLGGADFNRLSWEAEQLMDEATTGLDGVRKLRVAMPTDEHDAATVRRCACVLVDTLHQLEEAAENIRKSQALIENADGTVQSRQIASRSAGGESISFVTGSAARSGGSAVDAAVSDLTARRRLFDELLRRYLSGIPDANGVNLLYLGRYPVRLEG